MGKVVEWWDIKPEATSGGVPEEAIGAHCGSVKIQKENGRFQ